MKDGKLRKNSGEKKSSKSKKRLTTKMTSSINEDLMVNKLPFYNPIELKEKD
tara:strand:+ start:83 stop:238 length:156 start_codon:yes stop_codon:yes gene_type:complete